MTNLRPRALCACVLRLVRGACQLGLPTLSQQSAACKDCEKTELLARVPGRCPPNSLTIHPSIHPPPSPLPEPPLPTLPPPPCKGAFG